jgi:hypothetical protein
MRTCPKCSLLSPDSAVMCDCGHPFDPAGAEAALSTGFRPRNEVDPPGPSKGAKFAVGLLGFVVGCLPLGMFAEYQAALGHGDNGLIRGFSYVTGIAGILVALRLQKRRHESLSGARRTR